jgi:hypothetical protein
MSVKIILKNGDCDVDVKRVSAKPLDFIEWHNLAKNDVVITFLNGSPVECGVTFTVPAQGKIKCAAPKTQIPVSTSTP